jgi:uncharacterized protein
MTSLIADRTPADLTITPRDRRFGRGSVQSRWWLGGDPIATAFYNALSITFPRGEAMFIEAVRAHRDGTPPKLEAEINAFIKQEVIHSREHVSFNTRVVDAGYDVGRLEQAVIETLALTKDRPPIVKLAVTMALEHYTAMMAQELLSNAAHFKGADQTSADMWRWHAIEEIEHKGVAYDTWLHATRDWSRGKRWRLKALMMVIVTFKFWPRRIVGAKDLLAQDGITGWRANWGLATLLLGRPGMVRRIIPAWFSYFIPGFHPWNHDDRHLIKLVDSEYEAARLPIAA